MHSAAMHKPPPKLLQHRIDEQDPSAPLQCVHVCVCVWCQCLLCVFLLLFIWKQQGRNTGHFVFLCVFVAYWFDHCLSKSEWEREGGVYSTVDYRSPVRVWYSRLWLFREIQYIFMCIATQNIFNFYSLSVCVRLRARACHTAFPCCHGDVAGTETVVAGWGRAQRGAELRLTVTVTLERGE